MKIKYTTRIVLMATALFIIPLLILQFVSLWAVGSVGSAIGSGSFDSSKSIYNTSYEEISQLQESIVKQKSIDVAKQAELYIRFHPDMSLPELRSDEQFRKIAVQQFGSTGYTSLFDEKNLVLSMHANRSMEGYGLLMTKASYPSLWKIINDSGIGMQSSGYYEWKSLNGTPEERYGYIYPINALTSDGNNALAIWSSISLSEITEKPSELGKIANQSYLRLYDNTKSLTTGSHYIIIIVFVISLAIAILSAFIFSRVVTSPMKKLIKYSKELAKGNMDAKSGIRGNDEISQASHALELMSFDLKKTKADLDDCRKSMRKKFGST